VTSSGGLTNLFRAAISLSGVDRGREKNDGTYQDPVVVIVLNLSPLGWRSPTLLVPSTFDNLFHEMGHAMHSMHSMLGRTKYPHVTGHGHEVFHRLCEVPSTLMEFFASYPRVLARLNRHYKTGSKLPEQTIEKLCATKKIFPGTELLAQQTIYYEADLMMIFQMLRL